MRTSTTAACLALLVLALLAPPAASADEVRRAALGAQPSADGDRAAFQVSGCYADARDDVTRGFGGSRVGAAPQADVTGFCLDHTASSLGVSMTVPGGTDPAADPTWDDLGAAAVFLYESASGAEREIQLSTQQGDGVFEYLVLEGTFAPTLVCSGNAAYAGGTYQASIPADCLAAPETIEVLAGFVYGRNGAEEPLADLAPADGDLVAVPRTAPAGAGDVTRLAGGNRIETAIRTSQASFGPGQAQAVVVALADNFPDALVAAPLAVARQAPVLLTSASAVPSVVREEARRAMGGTGQVLLLGGTAALSEAVADAFRDEGHQVERIAGDSRFATAVAAARAADPQPEEIVLAFGGDFPDALLAGAVAPVVGGVAVLVDRGGIPAEVQAYIDANPQARTLAIGNVAAAVAPDADGSVTGSSPSQISGALLGLYPRGGEVAVASVEAFPDGLAGGAYAGARGIPLVLSPRDSLTAQLQADLQAGGPYSRITFLGGVAALSETTAGQAAAYLQ